MRAEKSLGQHFLRDTRVLEDIAAITDVAHSDGCLEIGPGEGALTAFLVSSGKGKPIVAIDPDPANARAVRAYTKAGYEPVPHLAGRTPGVLIMQYRTAPREAAR